MPLLNFLRGCSDRLLVCDIELLQLNAARQIPGLQVFQRHLALRNGAAAKYYMLRGVFNEKGGEAEADA